VTAQKIRVGIRQWRVLSAMVLGPLEGMTREEIYAAMGTSADPVFKGGVLMGLLQRDLIAWTCTSCADETHPGCKLRLTPKAELCGPDARAWQAIRTGQH